MIMVYGFMCYYEHYVLVLNLLWESQAFYHRFFTLFDQLFHCYFPDIFFAVSKRKPTQIIETVKQLGRYLIRYSRNRVYDLDLIIYKYNHEAVYSETCLSRSCSKADTLLRRKDTFDPVCFLYAFLSRISKTKNCKKDTASDG